MRKQVKILLLSLGLMVVLVGFRGTYILAEDFSLAVNKDYPVYTLQDLSPRDSDQKIFVYLLKNGMIGENSTGVRDISGENIYFTVARWLDVNTKTEYTYEGLAGFDQAEFVNKELLPRGVLQLEDIDDLNKFIQVVGK